MEELLRASKNVQKIKNLNADEDSDQDIDNEAKEIEVIEEEVEENKAIPKKNTISNARQGRKWAKIAKDLNDNDLVNEVNEEGNLLKNLIDNL